MFGRIGGRSARDREVVDTLRRADKAARMGNPAAAAREQAAAAAILRQLVAAEPDDAQPGHRLGATLYALGRSLTAAGRPDEAVDALDEAEDTYLALPRGPAVAD
ncbi:MAG: hypothetical protein AVDCRST_MAG41-49, partial [uncultured Corynebacteriales bacterium]